jgi:protein TonB
MKFLRDNIQYPRISRENNSQGKALVAFVVNTDGSIQDIEVFRSSSDVYLDREAVRVVKAMPKWNPGKQAGKAVRVRFILPVTFRLQ